MFNTKYWLTPNVTGTWTIPCGPHAFTHRLAVILCVSLSAFFFLSFFFVLFLLVFFLFRSFFPFAFSFVFFSSYWSWRERREESNTGASHTQDMEQCPIVCHNQGTTLSSSSFLLCRRCDFFVTRNVVSGQRIMRHSFTV